VPLQQHISVFHKPIKIEDEDIGVEPVYRETVEMRQEPRDYPEQKGWFLGLRQNFGKKQFFIYRMFILSVFVS
jgi:hypothetical protein